MAVVGQSGLATPRRYLARGQVEKFSLDVSVTAAKLGKPAKIELSA